jgi:gamma-glutamyltranspeptidase / glutathione hydrolase
MTPRAATAWSARGRAVVASADQRATSAGLAVLAAGGNAVDAAIATNAVMTVVAPHLCGLGGDLFALVHANDTTYALNASGRAGSGADPGQLRAEGFTRMPFRQDIRSVTVPGCVDGWVSLHQRFGTRSIAELVAPAISLAADGFQPSQPLLDALATLPEGSLPTLSQARVGEELPLGGVARTLRAIAADGRDGFYEGEFGAGLIELGVGLFSAADLATTQADWIAPLSAAAFGVELHTMPPNSQGYLALAAAQLADRVALPHDPDDPMWAHLLIECAKAAGFDRQAVLSEEADGVALLTRVSARLDTIDPRRAQRRTPPVAVGDTTYLCVVDDRGMGVSLIQSNAAGFGSWLAEPNTGIGLHNRGIGFSLEPRHPAEFGAGRRPPHTLAPALATRNGRLAAVFGTMGGDAQPQILLQIAARLFLCGQDVATAIHAGRWALSGPQTGFDTWIGADVMVDVEGQSPASWQPALVARGHDIRLKQSYDAGFGHAHAIVVEPDGVAGCADPRTVVGSCEAL